ncbi:MEDS domain-containing protein [Streptomyces sp. Wb2n-11]|uniref:MEDS domain-containing protein n=1 Tax=Streptomyces sp. Wb2n-11 TaxID=1030533 RepID=UPI000AF8F323|nr:MEDS domain-containing protein [Streptomyces sp. Wb2n-11]
MDQRADAHPGLLPVQGMRAGDHAFLGYDDDEANWGALVAYTRTGLARGEKVIVFAAPQLDPDAVRLRLDGTSPLLAEARGRGQLTHSSMRALIRPDRRFTPERQWERLREETSLAVAQGYRGLRAFIDMHWVADLDADVATMTYRESHAGHLFDGRPYNEVCSYDRRAFDSDVLDAMSDAHPRSLLSALGELRVLHADDSVRIAGEADHATREPFATALRAALDRTAGSRLLVDLGSLHFLGARCALDLIDLVDHGHRVPGASGHGGVEVRCGAAQAVLLRRLGSGGVRHLTLTEVAREW